jgi:hypothetical protein
MRLMRDVRGTDAATAPGHRRRHARISRPPFDVVPDFIPVAGQVDDAVVVALALRAILRAGGLEMIDELWPGPRWSPSVILKLADPGAKTS